MARYHGRGGRVYLGVNGASPSPAASLQTWSLDTTVDTVDVTAFGDSNKQYVPGFKDVKGTIAGFWDSADDTMFNSVDATAGGNSIGMYLYPATNASVKYWYGAAYISATINTSHSDAVKINGTFSAAGNWSRF